MYSQPEEELRRSHSGCVRGGAKHQKAAGRTGWMGWAAGRRRKQWGVHCPAAQRKSAGTSAHALSVLGEGESWWGRGSEGKDLAVFLGVDSVVRAGRPPL